MTRRVLAVGREAAGLRLDRFLRDSLPNVSLERARALLAEGRVRIRGKVASPVRKLWPGEEVSLELPPPRPLVEATTEGPSLPLLLDDEALVIVDKPAGLVVETGDGTPSVVALLAGRLAGFDVEGVAAPGVAHRLDRDTSGVLVLARTDEALASLRGAFEAKQIDKRYRAIVLGEPPPRGELDTPYARDPRDPRRYTTRVPSARRAALRFEVLERLPGAALIEVQLLTGRTHQIRAQLADLGHPVLGDPLYGRPAPEGSPLEAAARRAGRQALHAARLALPHPQTGARVEREAPLPHELAQALEALRLNG